jgi:hypothetical protein
MTLESQVSDAEQADHAINARAFPVIAFGAILSGGTDDLARWPWLLALPWIITMIYTFSSLRTVARQLRRPSA